MHHGSRDYTSPDFDPNEWYNNDYHSDYEYEEPPDWFYIILGAFFTCAFAIQGAVRWIMSPFLRKVR